MNKLIDRIDRMLSFRSLLSLLMAALTLFSVMSTGTVVYAAEAKEKYDVDYNKPVIVSMGDSFSAGEGIEPFYNDNLDNEDKVKDADWLAHRSEKSWPGMLRFSGLYGNTREYKDTNWFFVAASGAETKHVQYEQKKDYSRGWRCQFSGTEWLNPQIDIFKELEAGSVDYVTMTMGGNDAGFSKIITEAVTGSTYLNTSKLADMLADTWTEFYKKNGIRDNLYQCYKDVEAAAGPQAQIIVAGYPHLLDPDGGGLPFSKEEATDINRAVSNFNLEIERLVNQCASENMKICFVSVEDAFSGHEAYSDWPFINKVIIGSEDEDLKNFCAASSYSIHPNYDGAVAYAQCVNRKIEELEAAEAERWEQEAMNPTPKDREVVLVLDQSGSMSGTPMNETKTAAHRFINTVLEEETNVGIVAYSYDATLYSALNSSKGYLNKAVDSISTTGNTNIEAGLALADEMLRTSEAKKKIIVLMSDGLPNVGKVGQDLIDYATELKDKGYYVYTLGFFSNLDGSTKSEAVSLMADIASTGCHFEVENAEELEFFFGDIADQISGTNYYYIRIACPVDVTVKYNGEVMTSKDNYSSIRTSFGTMTFEENTDEEDEDDDEDDSTYDSGNQRMNDTDDEDISESDNRVKILRLKEGVDYKIEIEGNGRGSMDYTIGFMDRDGEYSDMREFKNVRITKRTKIDTVAAESDETYMYVDEDGDGKYDITYRALADSRAEIVDNSYLIYIGIAVVAGIVLIVVILILRRRRKIKKYLIP